MKNSFSPAKIIRDSLKNRENHIKELQKDLVKDQRYISPRVPTTLAFNVELKTLWRNKGEVNVSLTTRGSLEKAISAAVEKFKKVNNRPDVQASFCVSIVMISGRDVKVPRLYYEHLIKKS